MQSKNYCNMSHIHSYDRCDFLIAIFAVLAWGEDNQHLNTETSTKVAGHHILAGSY
jgi:hypothetical protein